MKITYCGVDGCENVGKQKCSICLYRKYCSRDCQKKDWKTHKLHCRPPVQREESEISVADNNITITGLPDRDECATSVFFKFAMDHIKIEEMLKHCAVMFKDINPQGKGTLLIREELPLTIVLHLMSHSNYNLTSSKWKGQLQSHDNLGHSIFVISFDWLTVKEHYVKTICCIKTSNTLIIL